MCSCKYEQLYTCTYEELYWCTGVHLLHSCTVVPQILFLFFVFFQHLDRILFPNGCRLNVARNRNMTDFLLRYIHGCLLVKYKANMTILNGVFNSFKKLICSLVLCCFLVFIGIHVKLVTTVKIGMRVTLATIEINCH